MLMNVYRQAEPIKTKEVFYQYDPDIGDYVEDRWHRANLRLVGQASSWGEAKRMVAAPIVEPVRTLSAERL